MLELLINVYETVLYQPVYNLVVFFSVASPNQNLGWAIVMLALVVRIIFLPFTLRGYKTDETLEAVAPQVKEIEEDPNLNPTERRRKITELLRSKGINPLSEIYSLFGQLIFLAVLYQIVQEGLHPPYLKIYGFMPRPEDIQTVFFGYDISQSFNWIYSGIAAGALFIEQLWEYEDKKNIPEATFSGRWYPLLLPIFTFIILMLLPATKALFLTVSVLFSIGIRMMYSLAHLSKGENKEQTAH